MSTRRRRQLQIDVEDDLLPSSGRRSCACADWVGLPSSNSFFGAAPSHFLTNFDEKGVKMPGGPLVFKGGYHSRVKKHGKRVVFQGEARAARPVFRVSKTAKIKKKGMFFIRLNKKYVLRVYFLHTIKYVFRVVLVCRPIHCPHKMTLKLAKTSYFHGFLFPFCSLQ